MAKLTAEQWERARADYEIAGLTQRQVADKYKVSPGTVGERSKKERWKKGKTEQRKIDKVNAIIRLAEINEETEQELSKTEQHVLDCAVADEVAFRLQNDKDMQEVRDKVLTLLHSIDKPSEAKAIMDTLRIQREARLGKRPETQVNIQNSVETAPIRAIFEQ